MSVNSLTYSKSGLALTEGFEGLALTAYQDASPKRNWTIGYGHTGPDVYPGMVISKLQAETLLLQDVQSAVHCVNQSVNVVLTQNEFDALVDFVFNVGGANFASSTLLRLLNQSRFEECAKEFEVWDKAAGKPLPGLLRRRLDEEQQFRQPVATVPEQAV